LFIKEERLSPGSGRPQYSSDQRRVERKDKIFEWGVRVNGVLPEVPNPRTLKTLRLERRSGGNAYDDVHFDPTGSRDLSLVLVGGDRVS